MYMDCAEICYALLLLSLFRKLYSLCVNRMLYSWKFQGKIVIFIFLKYRSILLYGKQSLSENRVEQYACLIILYTFNDFYYIHVSRMSSILEREIYCSIARDIKKKLIAVLCITQVRSTKLFVVLLYFMRESKFGSRRRQVFHVAR